MRTLTVRLGRGRAWLMRSDGHMPGGGQGDVSQRQKRHLEPVQRCPTAQEANPKPEASVERPTLSRPSRCRGLA